MFQMVGVLYVDREQAWLVSRKGEEFQQFDPLLKQVLGCLKGQRAILDGEIVMLDEKGRSNFFVMARRTTLLSVRSDVAEWH
jgi:ATP-dependent DNA ligase